MSVLVTFKEMEARAWIFTWKTCPFSLHNGEAELLCGHLRECCSADSISSVLYCQNCQRGPHATSSSFLAALCHLSSKRVHVRPCDDILNARSDLTLPPRVMSNLSVHVPLQALYGG